MLFGVRLLAVVGLPHTFRNLHIREDGCESYTDYLKKGIIELGF